MFKRLFKSLSGNKPTDAQTRQASANPAPETAQMVTVYDAYGREMQISQKDWRDSVLLPAIKQNWDNPDELYSNIVTAFHDGFFADVLDAARHLVEIDPDVERSHTISGIALLKCGQVKEAENVLRDGIRKAGPTAVLLTNLAKVFSERGQDELAETTLRQAIQADPNMENGLGWWLAIHNERGGETAYVAALQEAAALPNSWLPQLWLARHYLDEQQVERAKELYRKILTAGHTEPDALMAISGDLGQHGQVALIPEFLQPVYEPDPSNIKAGINLLQAYLELGRRNDGLALLQKLYRLDIAPFKQHLDHFASEFDKLAQDAQEPAKVKPEELAMEYMLLTQPIWTYSLRQPTWLIREKPQEREAVLFFPLAQITNSSEAISHREDEVGRLTRAIPLYLAESAHMWTDFAGYNLFVVVKGGGPVVFGAESDDIKALFKSLPEAVVLCVTGTLGLKGEQFDLKLSLWNRHSGQKLYENNHRGEETEIGAMILKAEQELLAQIGTPASAPFNSFYVRPDIEMMPIYLTALGQSFTLTGAANEIIPKTSLWGERNMLEWPLHMMLQWPQAGQLGVMYVSGLAKAHLYGSDILGEFERRTQELAKGAEPANQMVAHLRPMADRIFSLPPGDEPAADQNYQQWIDRLNSEQG